MTIKELWNCVYQNLLPFESEREARVIAYRIIEYYTDFNKLQINLNPQIEIMQDVIEKVNTAISILKTGKPIQYLIGETTFGDAEIFVDENVLIPRPETEELLYWLLQENVNFEGSIIDLCTGSACIAIAFGLKNPKATLFALDYLPQILTIAKKNAAHNKVKINFLCYDILNEEFRNSFSQKCHIIVSNPPYVRMAEKAYMEDKVLKFEPSYALFVPDEDPLIFYHAIVQWAAKNLVSGGKLYFEINEYLSDKVIELLESFEFYDIILRFDMQNKARMIRAVK